MVAGPYVPTSFTGEQITQQKLQQMANNDQWLFENSSRVRYNYGVVRDSQVKIIAGKTPYPATTNDNIDVYVYFGSFFSASCKPVVAASVEPGLGTIGLSIAGLTFGAEMDYRGFRGHVYQDYYELRNSLQYAGWVHWIAVGY